MRANRLPSSDWLGYIWAVIVVAAATAIGWPVYHKLGVTNTNILMLYLLGVLWIAVRHSRGAAMLTALLSVAAFDFCFVPPYLTFAVSEQQDLFTFAVMLITALLIASLTNRVRVQSEAARRAWEIAESEFLRNTLLSGVSHDLRTPLAAITGAVTTLTQPGRPLSPDGQREMLETIQSESERMERLVNNLLNITRLESGGLVLKKEWLPLAEVIGSALHHLDRQLRGRQIRVHLPQDLPLALIDGVAIEQVLVNLVQNALEYTPASSPIEIRAARGRDELSVEVADQGPGLPAGIEQRVFEKFFRAPTSDGKVRGGVGLGLAICRGVVEAHGGKITAANRPQGGAAFRFVLPQLTKPPTIDSAQ